MKLNENTVFDDKIVEKSALIERIREKFSYQYIPEKAKFRENEINLIISSLSGYRDVLLRGELSTGKTLSVIVSIKELEKLNDLLIEKEDRKLPIKYSYINCKYIFSKAELYREILQDIGVSDSQKGVGIDALRRKLTKKLESFSHLVLVLDDVDSFIEKKPNDKDLFNYVIDSEKISVVLVSNIRDWVSLLEAKILSRFKPNSILLDIYSYTQIYQIIENRIAEAEAKDYITIKELEMICKVATAEVDSVRTALTITYEIIRRKIDGEIGESLTVEDLEEIIGKTTKRKMRSILQSLHKTSQHLLLVIAKMEKLNYTKYKESKLKQEITTLRILKNWRKGSAGKENKPDTSRRSIARWLAFLENSGMIKITKTSAGRIGTSNYIALKYSWKAIIESLEDISSKLEIG